ncbi:MAG: MarR family transcriptional regulator [Bacteroidota bacterium]
MKKVVDLLNQLKKKCLELDLICMKEHNISDSEYNFFLIVSDCKRLNSKSIAEKMGLSLSRTSRIIDKLVNNGLIERDHNIKDRRIINIRLSKKGIDLKTKIDNFRIECETRITENIPASKLNIIKESFEDIINVL